MQETHGSFRAACEEIRTVLICHFSPEGLFNLSL